LAGQALLDRLLGQQRRADHHVRVGGVGAGGDGGDDDVTVVEARLGAVLQGDLDLVGGTGVVVLGRVGRGERAVVGAGVGRQRVTEGGLGVGQLDPVLRALRAGDGR